MKTKRILIISIAALVLAFTFAACGGGSSEVISIDEQSVQQQTETTPAKEVVTQEPAVQDTNADASDLTGSWTDVSDESRFVNITQEGGGYVYEDNEGRLPAEYKDGALEIKVSDTDTAKVYIDKSTGHLMLVYQDNSSEFKKK
jgi:hypothetical protein